MAWDVPLPMKIVSAALIVGMSTPGAATVRYGCREENSGARRWASTAATATTPRQTPGSSVGLSFSPELPPAATTIAPLDKA